MIKKLLSATLIIFAIAIASPAYAVDLSVEQDKTRRIEKDKSLSTRDSHEKRKSSGNKQTETTASGTDQQSQEILKQMGQRMQHSGLDVSLSLGNLFLEGLAMLEPSNPILCAKLLTHPRQPADFGLSAEIRPGVIDSIKQEWLNKASTSNSLISTITADKKIREYRDNLALYGIIIGQAYLNLTHDLAELGSEVTKDQEGNIALNNLGYDDLLTLADGALLQAVTQITNKRLKRLFKAITNDKKPCRFGGAVTTIQCGSATVTVGGQPALTALGIIVFNQDQFSGFTGNYKVSSGWSYDQALEKMKSTAKYAKVAEEISKYSDKMESQGKSREAIMVKKLAWSQAQSGKHALSLSKIIPGLQ